MIEIIIKKNNYEFYNKILLKLIELLKIYIYIFLFIIYKF